MKSNPIRTELLMQDTEGTLKCELTRGFAFSRGLDQEELYIVSGMDLIRLRDAANNPFTTIALAVQLGDTKARESALALSAGYQLTS